MILSAIQMILGLSDLPLTGNLIRLWSGHDNEWGYSNLVELVQMLDTILAVANNT